MIDYKKHPASQVYFWAEYGLSEKMSLEALDEFISRPECTKSKLEYLANDAIYEEVKLAAKKALEERE